MGQIKNIKLHIVTDIKEQKTKHQITMTETEPTATRGTIYVGHIPHGFYDNQIRGYFTQFGTVTKVRLARSKKNGAYKGYGYVQFAEEEVAKIAAEAMNNYMMFDKLLKCQFVAEEKLHPAVWKGANKKFVWLNRAAVMRNRHNVMKDKDQLKVSTDRLLKKERKKREKLLACGIQYDFPGYTAALAKERKRRKLAKKVKSESKDKAVEDNTVPLQTEGQDVPILKSEAE